MFHIRSTSPILVDLPRGRQGLANPTWCGKTRLPDGDRAGHAYDLDPATVTCPTCHHLYICPTTAAPDIEEAERCQVCTHLYECADQACRDHHHPGILAPPAASQPGSTPADGCTTGRARTAHGSPPRHRDSEAVPTDGTQSAARAALAYLFDPGAYLARLLTTAGGPQAAYHQLRREGGRPEGLRAELSQLDSDRLWHRADRITDMVTAAGGRVVIPGDEQWPVRLPDLAAGTSPPAGDDLPGVLCLFVHGSAPVDRLLARSIGITGSRAATAYGTSVSSELGYGCTCAGWTVVSGGGYGCDSAAHRGALAGGGATVAVVPAGLDRPHPSGHQALFEQVVNQGGLLVSIYPPGVPTNRQRVAATGRLLATLTTGMVLVEASRRSTSLLALRHAGLLRRPAMVVPGPVTSATSAGCHQALREDPRLRLVTSTAEVLAELQPATADRAHDHTPQT